MEILSDMPSLGFLARMEPAGTCQYFVKKVKRKVFYGQEPPSEESTITECGVNYQLLSVIY